MNWIHLGIIIALFYVIWFTYILWKRKYNKTLLLVGLAHIPYLLVNLVAPFRGFIDAMYSGYVFGWIRVPQGPWVPVVVGFIVIGSLVIASKAILNEMEKWWLFAFIFDLGLSTMVAFPVLLEIVMDPKGSTIELGEYLRISGVLVAMLIFILFSGPTFFAAFITGKKVWQKFFTNSSN